MFNLRLAFARYLPPDARLGMLERRRAHLLERLVQVRARVKAGRERGDGYTRSLMEHDREAAEHDLSWIERLIETERAGAAGPNRPQPAAARSTGPNPDLPRAELPHADLSDDGASSPTTSQEDTYL